MLKYIIACVCVFTFSGVIQLLRFLLQNRKPIYLEMDRYEESGIAVFTLHLPRSWDVRAGQRANLTVPSVGLFYLFQAHPFTIAWWEEDKLFRAVSLTLLLRPQRGFTRRLLKRVEPGRKFWALVNGPFGPSSTNNWGLIGTVSDYNSILLIATGIGIAAQIPYVKELLRKRQRGQVALEKITLLWRMDRSGDWGGARQWLQKLVEMDNDFVGAYLSPPELV